MWASAPFCGAGGRRRLFRAPACHDASGVDGCGENGGHSNWGDEMGFIKWTAEVKELLGADTLTGLQRASSDYVCAAGCGKPGHAKREKSSIIVFVGEGMAVPTIQLAHGKCADPQIVNVGESPVPAGDDADEVSSLAVLWAGGDGPIAGLIIDHTPMLTLISGSAATEDPWVQALLLRNWTLVTDPVQACPLVPDWYVQVDAAGGGQVVDASGLVLLDRLPNPTSEWIRAATDRAMVRVYAGDVRMDKSTPSEAVVSAIKAGRVAAAYLAVRS